MSTYGFHGLHGRAFPVACGVRSRRPDLHIFVVTGDGDCCAIGTAHWIHAIRYNMNLTIIAARQQHLRTDQESDVADNADRRALEHPPQGLDAFAAEPNHASRWESPTPPL